MARKGKTDKRLEETITLGKKNKELMPQIKNWCTNIELKDVSGGMVAQIYQLPITVRISCPHSSGEFEAMNLEWNAHQFIIDYCQSCEFHKEVHENNFGNDVITQYLAHQETTKKAGEEEAQKKLAFKKQVEDLVKEEASNANITELSILNLIQSIENCEDRKNVAMKILESSKLSPHFFGNIALEYLSLFFDDEEIGNEVLQSFQNAMIFGKELSTFCFQRLVAALEKGDYIDEIAFILRIIVEKEGIEKHKTLLKQVLNCLWYKRHIGDPYDSRPSYPNSISLLVESHKQDSELIDNLLDERLKIDDKTTRINTNYLLHELILSNSELVIPHCIAIIKSIELDDDEYEQSADAITCETLSKLYKNHKDAVINQVNELFPSLNDNAKCELLHFFRLILLKEEFASESQEHGSLIVENLKQIIFSSSSSKDLVETTLRILEDISDDCPAILSDSFDSMVGYFVEQIRELNTFQWYVNELKQPKQNISTFNKLQGKNYLDIETERLRLRMTINRSESIVKNLISNDPDKASHNKILEIILNLKSATDGVLKSKLIHLIRSSVKETVQIAELLPFIYTHLLDTESKDVRYEAIGFVAQLIDDHDQLVTSTLIDMIKVFMNDIDRLVKAKAIETFGSVIRKFPNEIEEDQIQIVLKSTSDKYIIIHKSATKLAYKVFPFLNEIQKFQLVTSINSLEEYYYTQQDYTYCQELLEVLLFLTKENPEVYSYIVQKVLSKYCETEEYYTNLESIKKITFIREQNDKFNKIWLRLILGFLLRTKPDYYNPSLDERRDFLCTIYKLPKQIVVDELEQIKNIITEKINAFHFSDITEILSILGYFSLYEPLHELAQYFNITVKQTKSNEHAKEIISIYERISELELNIANKKIDKKYLNSLIRE